MPSPSLGDIRAQVIRYWQIEDLGAAVEITEQAVADSPSDGRLWELHGLARKKQGNIQGACEALETANSLVPLSAPAQLALADCYYRQGRKDATRVILTYLATRATCPTGTLAELAAGLGKLGELELALRTCRLASEREPERDEPLYGMAYYMRRLRYPTEMIAGVVAQAQRLDPRSPTYRVALAILYVELDRLADAHALVRELAIDRLRCRHCLEKLERLYGRMGDSRLQAECQSRLSELESHSEDASWTPPCGPC